MSVIGVCEVIPRQLPSSDFPNTNFNGEAALFIVMSQSCEANSPGTLLGSMLYTVVKDLEVPFCVAFACFD